MQLKMWILTGTAIALWLTPLVALDKKVTWHKSIQGLSLCAAVACAIGAGNIARHLADENEIEQLKQRAIKADVEDEISTSVYVSQQQRQQEAEQVLNGASEFSEDVQKLERALALTYSEDTPSSEEPSKQLTKNEVEPEPEPEKNQDAERQEQIMQLRSRGHSKAKIILELWGVSKGGSQKYKAAEAEYKRLVGD